MKPLQSNLAANIDSTTGEIANIRAELLNSRPIHD